LVLDSLSGVDRCRQIVEAFTAAGGAGPIVLIRRVWIGDVPTGATAAQGEQLDRYRGYAAASAQQHWSSDQIVGHDVVAVAHALAEQVRKVGATSLNLRIHSPGISTSMIKTQIEALGPVVDRLRPMVA
jgi:hypothetical protein